MQPCAVGTEVICEIPLPGGRRQLRGRVARMQALSPAAVGLAIAFTDLAAPDEEMLSEAVGQDGGRSRVVQVRFEGMREAMRSRAQLTEGGLRLSTALPFLRLRSPVEVTFLSGTSKVQSRGLVRKVELDQFATDGTPRLAVSVAFASENELQPGQPVAIAAPPETTPTSPALPVAAATPVAMPAAEEPPAAAVPAPRQTAWTRVLAVAAAVALVGLATLSYYRAPSAPPTAELITQPAPAPVAPAPAPVAPAPVTPPPAAAPAPAPTVAEAAPTAQPQPTPPPARVVIPHPLPAGTPGPTVDTNGAETTAVIPVGGSTGGMMHYSLAGRRGLAVNLPHASSQLPLGLHAVQRDGIRYVWIRDRADGGIQVRFIFTQPPPDERLLELGDDSLKIRIRLHDNAVATRAPADPTIADGSDDLIETTVDDLPLAGTPAQ